MLSRYMLSQAHRTPGNEVSVQTANAANLEGRAFSTINLRALTSSNSRFSPKSVHPFTDTGKQKSSLVVAEASARFRQEARTGRTRRDGQPPNPERPDQDRANQRRRWPTSAADRTMRPSPGGWCACFGGTASTPALRQSHREPPDSRCHREPPCHQGPPAIENEPPLSAKRLRGVLRTSASTTVSKTTISGRLVLVPRRCVVERRDRGNHLITLAPSAPPASCVELLAVPTFIANRTMRIEMLHGHGCYCPPEQLPLRWVTLRSVRAVANRRIVTLDCRGEGISNGP